MRHCYAPRLEQFSYLPPEKWLEVASRELSHVSAVVPNWDVSIRAFETCTCVRNNRL